MSEITPELLARVKAAAEGGWTSDGRSLVQVGDLRKLIRAVEAKQPDLPTILRSLAADIERGR